jgi:hypothetical protein
LRKRNAFLKEEAMKELARMFLPRFVIVLLLSVGIAVACSFAVAAVSEPPGSDVFATPREALLREKPAPGARVVGRLPQGTRLALLEAREQFLKVETPGLPAGWIAREVAVVFPPDAASTKDMVAVGRAFGRNDGNRRLAAGLLERASQRLREAKTPDPEVEVLLGETSEGLSAAAGPPSKEIRIVEKSGAAGARSSYDGAAFERAIEMLAKDPSQERAALRERAMAGILRARYPGRSTSLPSLAQEAGAWLQLAETAEDPAVLRSAAERAGTASLALGRYLLALGKQDELGKLEDRARSAGGRVRKLLADSSDGARLGARAEVLRAMRGNGAPAFPQELKVVAGAKERVVRIEGKLGALQLVVETRVGGTRDTGVRKAAVPILPVPGSLRVSPDGRTVAWVEVAGPSLLVPVTTSLERDEPAREIAFLSNGRPLRDRTLAHVVASLAGFSKDGQRLGLTIDAWNETPGPAPRYSVVSVATGDLLFETSRDIKSFQRLLQ